MLGNYQSIVQNDILFYVPISSVCKNSSDSISSLTLGMVRFFVVCSFSNSNGYGMHCVCFFLIFLFRIPLMTNNV